MCNTFQKAREFNINKLAAARMRARFVLESIDVYIEDGSSLCLYWAKEELYDLIDLLANSGFTVSDILSTANNVTDDMIEHAKAYPVDRLIEFTRGKAKAFCHEDANPSLIYLDKKGIAWCPVCNVYYRSIDVLIKRDGYLFVDAVRYLSRE